MRRKASWFSAGGVLHPEEPAGLDALAEAGRLDRRQPVVHVVQEVETEAEALPYGLQVRRCEAEVGLGVPGLLVGQIGRGRFVDLALADAVRAADVRDGRLGAHGLVAELQIALDVVEEGGHVGAAGVRVDQDAVPGPAAEQLVHGESGGLALDVPQGRVDGGDGRHGDRAAPPVGALVEVLPGVLDPRRVAADEARDHMVGEV